MISPRITASGVNMMRNGLSMTPSHSRNSLSQPRVLRKFSDHKCESASWSRTAISRNSISGRRRAGSLVRHRGKRVAEQQAAQRGDAGHVERVQHVGIQRIEEPAVVVQGEHHADKVRVVARQKAGGEDHQIRQQRTASASRRSVPQWLSADDYASVSYGSTTSQFGTQLTAIFWFSEWSKSGSSSLKNSLTVSSLPFSSSTVDSSVMPL